MSKSVSSKIIIDQTDYFLPNYLQAVNFKENIFELLYQSAQEIEQFYLNIPKEKIDFAYEKNKWTIAEILQHITDSERVIGMRALCFARGEQQNLPGFNQDVYYENAASKLSFEKKVEEIVLLRKSHQLMFQSFDEIQLQKTGVSSGFLRTVEAHAYMIVGHEMHHRKTIQERYLNT